MNALPQELIEEIVSRTSPVHACGKLSLLSKSFLSAAKSDHVWERFLPVDIFSRRVQDQGEYDDPWDNIDSDTLHAFPSKKDLYLFLCDNPLCIDNGAMCFWLDKLSGNKCFHIGPRSLTLGDPDGSWAESQEYPWGRFNDIPMLHQYIHDGAQKLEIEGKISTSLLSPNVTYTACLLFDFTLHFFQGFGEGQPLETFVGIDGYGESENRVVYIPVWNPKYQSPEKPAFIGPQYPVLRQDGWYEIELGNYFNKEGGENGELRMSLREVKSGKNKVGICLFGIEIRPKSL